MFFQRHMCNSFTFPSPGFSAPISDVYGVSIRLVFADFIHIFRNRVGSQRSPCLYLAAGRPLHVGLTGN